MKEIRASELNVGDVVYNCISVDAGWTHIGEYYRKEFVKRITPKRTKIVTDHGEYKAHYKFYEYNEEIKRINSETMKKKGIFLLRYELNNLISRDKKLLDLPVEKIEILYNLLKESVNIFRGEEKH